MNNKITSIILAGAMTLTLCACGSKAPATPLSTSTDIVPVEIPEDVGLPNPMVEYSSLDEINEELGGRLSHPAVMGVTDEAFYIINGEPEIAQYNFSINGMPYTYRFSYDYSADISGIYEGDGTVFENSTGDDFYEGESCKAARFVTTDGQYVLIVDDNGEMDSETFKAIAEELFSMSVQPDVGSPLDGLWIETIAGRGQMEIKVTGSTADITVTWPSSAAELITWLISGEISDDNSIEYSNATKISTFYGDKEYEEPETIYEDGTGTITLNDDGTLTWIEDGNIDEEGSVFAKN